jgi:hypothetical protein
MPVINAFFAIDSNRHGAELPPPKQVAIATHTSGETMRCAPFHPQRETAFTLYMNAMEAAKSYGALS